MFQFFSLLKINLNNQAAPKRKKETNSSGASNKKSAFQKDCFLSEPLSVIIGKDKVRD